MLPNVELPMVPLWQSEWRKISMQFSEFHGLSQVDQGSVELKDFIK